MRLYKIKVLHNYLYKLIEELPFLLPEAKYRITNGTIVTQDPKVVEAAKYVFQFQPDLLMVEYLVTAQKNSSKAGKKQEDLIMPSVLLS